MQYGIGTEHDISRLIVSAYEKYGDNSHLHEKFHTWNIHFVFSNMKKMCL